MMYLTSEYIPDIIKTDPQVPNHYIVRLKPDINRSISTTDFTYITNKLKQRQQIDCAKHLKAYFNILLTCTNN
jgi:hypothetical protein